MHIVPLLDESFLLLSEDGLLPQVRTDHETIALLPERHDCLPNVHLGQARVQDDLPNDRPQIFEVLGSGRRPPLQRLRHVVSRAERQRNEDKLADIDEFLQHLDGPHDAPVTPHKNDNDLCTPIVTIDRLLDHFVAALAVVFLEHVEKVAIGAHIMLFKFALHVALLVEKLLGFLVAGAWIRGDENVMCVGLVHAVS